MQLPELPAGSTFRQVRRMLTGSFTPDGYSSDDCPELSVVMPCLDEAETVATCVRKAHSFFWRHNVSGEVVVADNGSTDASPALAAMAGARVINVRRRGYGSALMGGIRAARGRYIIMADADDSYDLTDLMPFLERLRAGADLVMGNRFQGGIAPGAMPHLHRYIGNPLLSFIGRLFFNSRIRDFHCGIRGFDRQRILQLRLQATGMEFASEIVVKAALAGYKVEEVPTTLSPDGRSRPPHLRSWRDGWRHLRFLLLFSPRWLFFYPGLFMMIAGAGMGAAIIHGPLSVAGATLDVGTLAAACALVTIGLQLVFFAFFTWVYASNEGFLPPNRIVTGLLKVWKLERGLALGAALGLAGIVGLVIALGTWSRGFSNLAYGPAVRIVLPSMTALVISCQLTFGAFFLSILGIRRTGHKIDSADIEPADIEPDIAPAVAEAADMTSISEAPARASSTLPA